MFRFLEGQGAYNTINYVAFVILMVSSIFLFPLKHKVLSIYSRHIVQSVLHTNKYAGYIAKFILASIESLIFAYTINLSTYANWSFGQIVGTGANYFAVLLIVPVAWFIISSILVINPLKQSDINTLLLPLYLFFVKFACFCHGCCWGIPWEYGPYNHHPDHPGNQVPVQAIEMFFALVIFIFLLFYIRKAKAGTVYPMYLILYGGTRFFSEFFTAAYPNVIGPFNTYQILCVSAILIGLLMLLIVKFFGHKITAIFEKPHKKFELKVAQKKEQDTIKLAEEKARAEADELERLEKIRRAREKAKAKRKK